MELAGATEAAELGLGVLWLQQMLALAQIANTMTEGGEDVTGASIYERLGTSDDLVTWPDGNPLACGAAASIPNVCNFSFPVGTYVGEGTVETVPGYEALDTLDLL